MEPKVKTVEVEEVLVVVAVVEANEEEKAGTATTPRTRGPTASTVMPEVAAKTVDVAD